MEADYTIKKLAKLAGVTVRTLHVYDKTGLLKPGKRTNAGYRLYSEKELLRLQQILFYKELNFPLREIAAILDSPNFDLVKALENHKKAITNHKTRLNTLIKTIDTTIYTLKNKKMLNTDELYKGLPRDEADGYRKEAIVKYGKEAVEKSENYINKLTKEQAKALGAEQKEIAAQLASMKGENPTSAPVQQLIARHYLNIRQFWGTAGDENKQAAAYKGLGKLYVADERFTMVDGIAQPEVSQFMSEAMAYYADTQLR